MLLTHPFRNLLLSVFVTGTLLSLANAESPNDVSSLTSTSTSASTTKVNLVQDQETLKEQLATEWILTWDDSIDSKLSSAEKTCRVRFEVVEGKLKGVFADRVFGVERDAKFSGEVIVGNPSIFLFSQIEPEYTCVYQIHWSETRSRNRIGVWRDTRGASGDFTMRRSDEPEPVEIKEIDDRTETVETPIGTLTRLSSLKHFPMNRHENIRAVQESVLETGDQVENYFVLVEEKDDYIQITAYHKTTLINARFADDQVELSPTSVFSIHKKTGKLEVLRATSRITHTIEWLDR